MSKESLIATLKCNNERLRGELKKEQKRIADLEAENTKYREVLRFVDRWANYKVNKPEKPTSAADAIDVIATGIRVALEGEVTTLTGPIAQAIENTTLRARIEKLEAEIKTAIRQFEDRNGLECHRTLCTVIYGKQY